MNNFQPFNKNEILSFDSFIQIPRELMESEKYKSLNPDAILLFSLLADRLALSFKQNEKNSKVKYYDDDGNMYVILKRDEAEQKLHLKRTKLDKAIQLLKDVNLIQEKSQYNGLPNIIYVGKTDSMIQSAKIINFKSAEKQHSRVSNFDNPECRNSAPYNSYNNKYKNNNIYCPERNKNQDNYQGRIYKNGELDKFYYNVK